MHARLRNVSTNLLAAAVAAGAWRALAATVATAILLIASPGNAFAGAEYKRCKDVKIYVNGNIYARTYGLFQKRTTCRQARRVARKVLHGSEGSEAAPHPFGYSCRSGEDGVACRKGRKRVTWGYYYD